MKSIFLSCVMLCLALSSGCTTLQPTEATPDEIQRRIVTEGLLAPGDKVQLVTADDAVHEFRITEINLEAGSVIGKNDAVPITEIVAVATREFAVGKTTALSIGISYGLAIGIAVALGGVLVL